MCHCLYWPPVPLIFHLSLSLNVCLLSCLFICRHVHCYLCYLPFCQHLFLISSLSLNAMDLKHARHTEPGHFYSSQSLQTLRQCSGLSSFSHFGVCLYIQQVGSINTVSETHICVIIDHANFISVHHLFCSTVSPTIPCLRLLSSSHK